MPPPVRGSNSLGVDSFGTSPMTLPGGACVRNTFLEFDDRLDNEEEEDPWLITESMKPRRLKTDSVVERSSLRAVLEERVLHVLKGSLSPGAEAAKNSEIALKPPTSPVVSYSSAFDNTPLRLGAQVASPNPQAPEIVATTNLPCASVAAGGSEGGQASAHSSTPTGRPPPLPRAPITAVPAILPEKVFEDEVPGDELQVADVQDIPKTWVNALALTASQSMAEAMEEGEGFADSMIPEQARTTSRVSAATDPAVIAARAVAASGGGLSGNTTVMMRHIPGKYTQQKLMREINSVGFLGKYDFFYLPMQPQSRGNRGFAFVNFSTAEDAESFYHTFHGRRLRHFRSEQAVAVMPADLQGFERNAAHYASIRKMGSRWRPLQNGRALFFRPLPAHLVDAGEDQEEATPINAVSATAAAACGSSAFAAAGGCSSDFRSVNSFGGPGGPSGPGVQASGGGVGPSPSPGAPQGLVQRFCAYCGKPKSP
eukprot:CAMPEP_0115323580 /NCGR_PEP_ID=MMETSP0270-20121206/82019_1 /TAXON_ID=71861 /ORGANISM="Scrippsiella trochoidea, Strain CCMP3099" /LENGTH=483 /DNA_ID=CAMNT_0002743637 /DNA_START=171 /DNA_END=1620 /DNA_ORIENTATION=+